MLLKNLLHPKSQRDRSAGSPGHDAARLLQYHDRGLVRSHRASLTFLLLDASL